MLYPLKFKSIFKERIWGGELIKTALHRDVNMDSSIIGESWDICDRDDDQSTVMNGYLANKTLRELRLEFQHALVGDKVDYTKDFPLFVKILDAKEDLSLQVHPRERDLPNLSFGAAPKTEFWYVLQNTEDAKIMAGLKNHNKKDFIKNINSKDLIDSINTYDSKENMLLYIESGTIHAIGGGNLILEIQQNSDTTYRVSDWGRLDSKGNPREIHIEESLLCIDFKDSTPPNIQEVSLDRTYKVVDSSIFESTSNCLNSLESRCTGSDSAEVLSLTQGAVILGYKHQEIYTEILVRKGESILIPPKISYMIKPCDESANFLLTKIK